MHLFTRIGKSQWSIVLKVVFTFCAVFLPAMVFAQASASNVIQPPKEFNPANWNWSLIFMLLATLLLILVTARVFDISHLSEKLTGKKVLNWNKINAWIAVVFLVLSAIGVWYEMEYHGRYILLNDSASEHGKTIDSMFNWTFGFTFVVFVVTEFLLFLFMFLYYYRPDRKALYYYHNNKLEMIWSIVPAIVLTLLVIRGFNTWSKITSEKPKNAQEIEVFAFQFGWKARYAGEDKQLGKSHFTFISGKNELGVAIHNDVDSLVNDLQVEIKGIQAKISNVAAYTSGAKAALERFKATHGAGYEKELKELQDAYEEANCGAYERGLKKELKRKEVQLQRIEKFKADRDVFNNAGNDDIITSEIVLVKNKSYIFKFRARDVIHSAWAPEFRVQMNCVPGMPTWFAFMPIKTTAEAKKEKGDKNFDYYLYCNKICGGNHSQMKIKITVVNSETELNEFLASQKTIVPKKVATTPESNKTEKKDTLNSSKPLAMNNTKNSFTLK